MADVPADGLAPDSIEVLLMIHPLGFFAELSPGWGLPLDGSIRDAVRLAGEFDEDRIAGYLRGGTGIWSEMSAGPDVLDPEAPDLTGIGSLYTDGTWIWREDLAYYLSKYHVTLPADFLGHARGLGYSAPRVPDSRLIEIATEDLGMDLG
ncbi:hypothetical protein [Streptomyces sp. NPDC093094]|uniref:hypothetical protein n=1 Tax=Streptomyces sp. NPDC093094 TaxID=3366026 RepID=UPI003802C4AF